MAQKTGIVKWFSARRGYGFITDEKGNDGKRYRRKINQKSQQKRDQIIIGRTGSNDGIIYSDCSIC